MMVKSSLLLVCGLILGLCLLTGGAHSDDPYNKSTTNIGGNNNALALTWRLLDGPPQRGKPFRVAVELHNQGVVEEKVCLSGISLMPALLGDPDQPSRPDEFGALATMRRRRVKDADFVTLMPGDYFGRTFTVDILNDPKFKKLILAIYYECKLNQPDVWDGRIGEVNSPEFSLEDPK